MGRLTDDMTRLVAEIQAGRTDRARLVRDIKRATAEMRHAVGRMLGGFRAAHAEMARRQQRVLRGFAAGLRSTVRSTQREFAADVGAARQAWVGAAMPGRRYAGRSGMASPA